MKTGTRLSPAPLAHEADTVPLAIWRIALDQRRDEGMITRRQAEKLVDAEIARSESSTSTDVVRSCTIERPWGWVFYYDTREAIETGDPLRGLVGNAPLLVERRTGRLFVTGTARPIEYYIRNFEATGNPHERLGREVEVTGLGPDAQRGPAARVLGHRSALTLVEAKRGLDRVASGRVLRAMTESPEVAQTLCGELNGLGVLARQRAEPAD